MHLICERKQTLPDLISYNAALSTCSKGQQWQLALSLLGRMAMEKVESDAVSFNSALSSCCEGLQWQRVFAILQDLPSIHLRPDCIACLPQLPLPDRSGPALDQCRPVLYQKLHGGFASC